MLKTFTIATNEQIYSLQFKMKKNTYFCLKQQQHTEEENKKLKHLFKKFESTQCNRNEINLGK